jgi:hypothetical protein
LYYFKRETLATIRLPVRFYDQLAQKSKPFKRKIIIRRIRRVIRQPPRGAWKIAYAGFVTALMAFF